MNKSIKVPASEAKVISDKLKKYENLNAACKNVVGGIGVGAFQRLSGIIAEDPQMKNA